MLVVKIEVWPGGVEKDAYEIERLLITNTGTNEYNCADYLAFRTGGEQLDHKLIVQAFEERGERIENHRRDLGPLPLVARAAEKVCRRSVPEAWRLTGTDKNSAE